MELKRRTIQRSDEEWETLIMGCLTGLHAAWGCLKKDGVLFRVRTFTNLRVPERIISGLICKGAIALNKEGFYKKRIVQEQPTTIKRRTFKRVDTPR